MEKYKIQIIKHEAEKYPVEAAMGLGRNLGISGREQIIFHGGMNADHAIEILQHLHDLKEREKQETEKERRENILQQAPKREY